MWANIEDWQLSQLLRLAANDPERVEAMLNTLWRSYPNLFGDLAIMAVDKEQISIDACADLLGVSPEVVEDRLKLLRRQASPVALAVVQDDSYNHVARLADYGIAVWEVVREFRKLGSVERLREVFPAVPEGQLAAALRYAQANPAEIELLIENYESMLARRRDEYPFAS
jgi:uncharacterized protein (DUF433 family)